MTALCFLDLLIIASYFINYSSAGDNPQYVFAHRVNDPSTLHTVLSTGFNGIEIDICYNTDWFVSHNGNCPTTENTLNHWLSQLKAILDDTPIYTTQLAMIWIDIKSPDDVSMDLLPDIVHSAQLPSEIKLIYDLVDFNDDGKKGFDAIVNHLNMNEGISFCADSGCYKNTGSIQDIYDYYVSEKFERGTFNTGHSIPNLMEIELYIAANSFKKQNDPYGFKLVFAWTVGKQHIMGEYIDPNNSYQTDGQIVGQFVTDWKPNDAKYFEMFEDALSVFSSTQRLATSNDDPFDYGQHTISHSDEYGDEFSDESSDESSDFSESESSSIASIEHVMERNKAVAGNGREEITPSNDNGIGNTYLIMTIKLCIILSTIVLLLVCGFCGYRHCIKPTRMIKIPMEPEMCEDIEDDKQSLYTTNNNEGLLVECSIHEESD